MEGIIVMNSNEQRVYNLALEVLHDRLSIREFGILIGKSYRQAQRIIKRINEKQMLGVKHGNFLRVPVNKINSEIKLQTQKLLREKYFDFNLTHFREKLTQVEGVELQRETLRKWAHEIGLVKKVRTSRRGRAHKPRPRMPRRGMLIQFDGSEHDWFSGQGPLCTLIGGVDDATSEISGLEFFAGEDSFNCMKVMENIIEIHGIPEAFYLDQAGYFGKTYREHDTTEIGRALGEIGSRVILANSPQAKGKIERLWGTMQDRLCAELRLRGIKRIPEANRFLKEIYIAEHNKKFAQAPRDNQSAFKSKKLNQNLKNIFCIKETRKIQNGNIFSYKNQTYVIEEKQNLRFRKIIIREHSDGTIDFEVYGRTIKATKIDPNPKVLAA